MAREIGYILIRRKNVGVDDFVGRITPNVTRLRRDNDIGFDLMARFSAKSVDELRAIRDELRLRDDVEQAELFIVEPVQQA